MPVSESVTVLFLAEVCVCVAVRGWRGQWSGGFSQECQIKHLWCMRSWVLTELMVLPISLGVLSFVLFSLQKNTVDWVNLAGFLQICSETTLNLSWGKVSAEKSRSPAYFELDLLELCVTDLSGQCSPNCVCGGAGAAPSSAGGAVAAQSELLC